MNSLPMARFSWFSQPCGRSGVARTYFRVEHPVVLAPLLVFGMRGIRVAWQIRAGPDRRCPGAIPMLGVMDVTSCLPRVRGVRLFENSLQPGLYLLHSFSVLEQDDELILTQARHLRLRPHAGIQAPDS